MNISRLKTASGLGVMVLSKRLSIARGTCGVGVIVGVSDIEGVGVMVGLRVMVGESVMVGLRVMVGLWVMVGEGGKY